MYLRRFLVVVYKSTIRVITNAVAASCCDFLDLRIVILLEPFNIRHGSAKNNLSSKNAKCVLV